MKIGGWKTRSVFERYAIVSQGDIAEAMRKLEHDSQAAMPASTELEEEIVERLQ
jgi:hypothetical protein